MTQVVMMLVDFVTDMFDGKATKPIAFIVTPIIYLVTVASPVLDRFNPLGDMALGTIRKEDQSYTESR